MAKKFHFDDEDDIQDEYQPSSYLDDLENKRENVPYTAIDEEDDEDYGYINWNYKCNLSRIRTSDMYTRY